MNQCRVDILWLCSATYLWQLSSIRRILGLSDITQESLTQVILKNRFSFHRLNQKDSGVYMRHGVRDSAGRWPVIETSTKRQEDWIVLLTLPGTCDTKVKFSHFWYVDEMSSASGEWCKHLHRKESGVRGGSVMCIIIGRPKASRGTPSSYLGAKGTFQMCEIIINTGPIFFHQAVTYPTPLDHIKPQSSHHLIRKLFKMHFETMILWKNNHSSIHISEK